jgi:FkbM family methyltransferase
MFFLNDKIRRNVLVASDQGLMIINRFDRNEKLVGSGQFLLDHGNTCSVEANACFDVLTGIKNPVIFDVGANIGTFSSWMSMLIPGSKIYAFEPQRLIFQIFCGNMAINNFYNVHAYNLALGENISRLIINEPDYDTPTDFGTFSLVDKNRIKTTNETAFVDIIPVDFFTAKEQITRIDLLKIDAEGMDLTVLKGAKETLEKFHPSILIEFTDDHTSIYDAIKEFLTPLNYSFEIVADRNLLCLSDNFK